MKKPLKILAIALGTLLGLLLLLVVALPLVFDPNRYRGEIIQTVKDKTGRDLRIEGKLGWSVFPRLAIEAGKLELGNAAGFGREPFARIDAAGVVVEWLPLLTGRVSVDTFYVNGLSVNLVRNASGQSNWEDLAAPRGAKPAAEPAAKRDASAKPPLAALAVGRLDIRNANLAYRDEQAGSAVAIRRLTLGTGRFEADKPFDLKLAFELARGESAPVQVTLDGRVTAGADALKLDNLRLALDDSRLTGTLAVSHFARPAIRFDLALDQIDLDRYLPKAAPRTVTATKAGAAPAAGGGALPVGALRTLDANGSFRAGTLKAFNLKLTDAQVTIKAKDGLIALGPNSAKAYGGLYRGEGRLDARGRALVVNLDESLKGVALDGLLKDAAGIDKFRGTANIETRLSCQGADVAALKASLDGNAQFGVQNGAIVGVDLKKFNETLDTAVKAKSLNKLAELKPSPGDQTAFTQLGGTAKVVKGVIRNDDLRIEAPGLVSVSGKGSANLARESLDYTVMIGRLPVRITGPFSSLSYKPDVQSAVGAEAAGKVEKRKKELEKQLKEKLQQQLRR
jgi:AsmA protein